jgi:hypothetical protein
LPDDSSERVVVSKLALQPNSNTKRMNSMNINYMTHKQQQKFTGEKLPSQKDFYLVKDHTLSTIQKQSIPISSIDNDLPSAITEEEQLIIDNVGSFGQKLNVHNKDFLVSSTTTSTENPILTHSDVPLASSTVQSEQYFHSNIRQKNNKPYLPNLIPGLGAYSSTTLPVRDNSVTANSIEFDNVQSHENNSIENEGWKSYSVASNIIIGSNFGTARNPILTNYGSQNVLSSNSESASATLDKKKDHSFLKPIIVPDVPKERPYQYSTTFECDEVPTTSNPIPSMKDTFGDTTSSYILNPIQAGVALVNAGETHLITNDMNHNETLPAPVKEKIQESFPYNQSATELLNTIHARENNYLGINTDFAGEQNATQTNQEIDIDKSVTTNQNIPEHNGQDSDKSTAFSEIQHIEQQEPIPLINNPQEQPYFTNADEFNSQKAPNNRIPSEILSKLYDFTDVHPKDLSDEKPIYVIPPATYILENNSILKNSLLQEKVRQYQGDVTDLNIKSDEEQIQVEAENGANAGVLYDSKVLLEQQQVVKKPGINFENGPEKTLHVTHGYPFEQVIGKKVPYTVESISEQKVPIPQPYPIQIQGQIPKLIPIHIEKIMERKIPVSVHIPIPHSYSIEKQIHIPVPIDKLLDKPVNIPISVEKIIEKKVPVPKIYPLEIEKLLDRNIPHPVEIKYLENTGPMQAPYGVQYGVSYQQIMKPQSHGLYSHKTNKLAPLYALPGSSKNLLISYNNNITKTINDVNINNLNHSKTFHGYIYDKPAIPFNEGKGHQFPNNKIGTKIFSYNPYIPSYTLSNAGLHRRYTDLQRSNKHEHDDYFGPVPPPHQIQRQFGFQSKAFSAYPLISDRTHNSRKSRNYEPVRHQKGNFRQSKIEYGFKPPMVPSVQYDEETASKVQR